MASAQLNPGPNYISNPNPNPIILILTPTLFLTLNLTLNDYFRHCAICTAPNTDSPGVGSGEKTF